MNRRHWTLSIAPLMVFGPWATTARAQSAAANLPVATQPTLKVGDTWRWVRSDRRTKLQEADTLRTVTAVSATRIQGTENGGTFVLSADLAAIETPDFLRLDDGAKFITFPLEVGKKWSFKYEQHNKNSTFKARWRWDAEVVGQEKIKVPAGEFDAFKIVLVGYFDGLNGGNGRSDVTTWYAPAARAGVRTWVESGRNSTETVLTELKLVP
jgi:hypothetical protein